jgi:hypothetical protein
MADLELTRTPADRRLYSLEDIGTLRLGLQERWSVSIRDGWLDTVDRLARALANTPTITAAR